MPLVHVDILCIISVRRMSLESLQCQTVDTKMEQKSGVTADSLSISRQSFFVLKDQGHS